MTTNFTRNSIDIQVECALACAMLRILQSDQPTFTINGVYSNVAQDSKTRWSEDSKLSGRAKLATPDDETKFKFAKRRAEKKGAIKQIGVCDDGRTFIYEFVPKRFYDYIIELFTDVLNDVVEEVYICEDGGYGYSTLDCIPPILSTRDVMLVNMTKRFYDLRH